MTMDVAELIASGETLGCEFKRGSISDKDLWHAVVCLANGPGGTILVGVEDEGTVTGASARHVSAPDRVAVAIQNNIIPAHAVEVHVREVDGTPILVIEVPTADPGPVGTKAGLFVRRVIGADGKPACHPMTAHEMVSRALVTYNIDYAATPALGATHEDLDPVEFDRLRALCATTSGDRDLARLGDGDILGALGLVPRDHPVGLGAILLFGRAHALHRWLPTAELLFQDMREGSRTNEELRLPLLRLAEEVQSRLDARDSHSEVVVGIQRIEIPTIPRATRREAVANALIHRDYSEMGPITVQLTDSEFTVSSPGGLPPGVTIDNILNVSRPRSMLLASAFKRAGLVERLGKGVNDMFESQLRAGRDAPDFTRSTDASVVVTVATGTSDLDLVRFLAAYQDQQQRSLSLEQLRVVHETRTTGPLTSSELADHVGLTATIARTVANQLVEAGILEARGNGRNRRFHLTARFYDLAEDRAAYVRVRGLDPLQQERMVLDYVSAYGQITRAQAAQLCQVAAVDARKLLKRLVERDLLELRGERRGAHYVLPDQPRAGGGGEG